MLISLKSGYILKFNFLMAHLTKGDYLSNYFHGTYHKYLPALTNAFTCRKNIDAKKITVSVKHEGI